jgi:hypothetical protein
MVQRTVKHVHRKREVYRAGRRSQRATWLYAIAGLAATTAAGLGVWSGHAQDSPGQYYEENYIALPESPSTIPAIPWIKQPEVILGSAKPAAQPPAGPVTRVMASRVAEASSPPPPAAAMAEKTADDSAQAKPPERVLPADAQKQDAAREAEDLLKMATELKSEVDKSTKDTLSVTVVRRAGEIEQMAHKVRTGVGLVAGKS